MCSFRESSEGCAFTMEALNIGELKTFNVEVFE